MAKCECLKQCPFFNDKLSNMPAYSMITKNKYCMGDSSECARYRIFKALGNGMVPLELYPHQSQIADRIIDENENVC